MQLRPSPFKWITLPSEPSSTLPTLAAIGHWRPTLPTARDKFWRALPFTSNAGHTFWFYDLHCYFSASLLLSSEVPVERVLFIFLTVCVTIALQRLWPTRSNWAEHRISPGWAFLPSSWLGTGWVTQQSSMGGWQRRQNSWSYTMAPHLVLWFECVPCAHHLET